jgi:hypothetical protein
MKEGKPSSSFLLWTARKGMAGQPIAINPSRADAPVLKIASWPAG